MASGLTVTYSDGSVRGEILDGIRRFLAIPYARAQSRWHQPQPPEPWADVRDNPRILPICPQPPHMLSHPLRTFAGHRQEQSEEHCMNLNVFTPVGADATQQALPVIFYIHGGAGKLGSAHVVDHASGQLLAARHNVVCVAANYRLGALGWLAHEAILAEGDGAACGNCGLLDLVCALRWVQAHVSAFGGDPTNVTIWGLSTGSQLVATLLVCPLARGLFARAVMQSCSDLCNVRDVRQRRDVWQRRSACEWGAALAEHLGCTGESAAARLKAMRELPSSAYVQASWAREATDCYEPATNRPLEPTTPNSGPKPLPSVEALSQGLFARVPVMLGVTAADGLGKMELEWTMFEDVQEVPDYERLLRQLFGPERLAEAQRAFGAASSAEVSAQLGAISECLWYSAATHMTADLLAGHGTPTYVYRVTQPGFTKHGGDNPLWNGVPKWRPPAQGSAPPAPDAVAPAEAPGDTGGDTGRATMAYLANFARSGDPNVGSLDGNDLPRWEPHVRGSERFMELGPNVGMASAADADAERARFALVQEHLRLSVAAIS